MNTRYIKLDELKNFLKEKNKEAKQDKIRALAELETIWHKQCYENGELKEEKFADLVKKISDVLDNNAIKTIIEVISNPEINNDAKFKNFVNIAFQSGHYDSNKSKNFKSIRNYWRDFLNILNNDEKELNKFISNPQSYLLSISSLHSQEILIRMYHSILFQEFLRQKNFQIFNLSPTKLSSQMEKKANLGYASLDAGAFGGNINPAMKEKVLARTNSSSLMTAISMAGVRSMAGVPISGENYTRKQISVNAEHVKKFKAGVCHTFAQFAADYLLTLMETQQINPQQIKIVTSEHGRGSHTFVLLGHNSKSLDDLSQSIIIDYWALAMGYSDTNAIFTKNDYPYPKFLSNLTCVYDSTSDPDHQAKIGNKPPTISSHNIFSQPSDTINKQMTLDFIQSMMKNLTPLHLQALTDLNTLKNQFYKDRNPEEFDILKTILKTVDILFRSGIPFNKNLEVINHPDNKKIKEFLNQYLDVKRNGTDDFTTETFKKLSDKISKEYGEHAAQLSARTSSRDLRR